MAYKNPEDGKAANRRWYAAHSAAHKQRSRRHRKRVYLEIRAVVDKIKEDSGCVDCNLPFPAYVLDFDHARGIKTKAVSTLLATGCSLAVVLAEIAKCDVVCANCHRERTHQRKSGVIGRVDKAAGCGPAQASSILA